MNQLKLNFEENKPIINSKNFDLILNSIILDMRNTLQSKGKDYAPNEDKLHNFKSGAKFLNCIPERVLLSYMNKHLVSIFDIIDNIDKGKPVPSPEYVREKLGDVRNYLVLLEALFYERRELEST